MDVARWRGNLQDYIKKYRYFLLILLLGLILMTLPQPHSEETMPSETTVYENTDLQKSLCEILSMIHGAGKVSVLLTQEIGEQTIYQENENSSDNTTRKDTVLISNASREETGLVQQIYSPVYRGAVVVCQGAENASVRLSIVEAVKSATGLTADHITVLKMK